MPTYDYICRACGHEFELFQQMSDPLKRKCPECGKPKLERLIGIGAGVLFKGGGFYETDYRSDTYKNAAEADKKGADAGSEPAKTDAKSDSAAAAPAESKTKTETTSEKGESSSTSSSTTDAGGRRSARSNATRKSSAKRSKPKRK